MAGASQAVRGEVTIHNLAKSFKINGRDINVLHGIDLHIRSGESLAVVGASGSGKTTLLRVLAGLEQADSGGVLIDGQPVHGVGTERAVIFQEPRLLPWRTVIENVTFPLELRGISRERARGVAQRYIQLVGLSDFTDALPSQLSGGMAQRVGIARALAIQPEILLLDEPLGALDAMTKITMQEELVRISREENLTMILVTHDLEEAVYLADRVLILPRQKGGRIREVSIDLDRPRNRSESRFVKYREELLAEFGLH
jgi:ABC-type nitrate/sulfonate/bicarbonate transport system ATPase subunit